MAQSTEHRIWKIVELFYKSFLAFRRVRDQHEERVARYCAEENLDRSTPSLNPIVLLERFDFRTLEEIRDRYLGALKEYCHQIFRTSETTDLFDRAVSDIFHEISILKEEIYTVEDTRPASILLNGRPESFSIVNEAARYFPEKVDHVELLFTMARGRLENLMPTFRDQKILTRSLFLNRRGFVAECYPRGLEDFYARMYPDAGPLAGYEHAGLSFYSSGFFPLACEAFEEGIALARRDREGRDVPSPALVESLAAHAARARAALEHGATAAVPPSSRK
jgi:hypothetical protein